jgi:hypothetical protein
MAFSSNNNLLLIAYKLNCLLCLASYGLGVILVVIIINIIVCIKPNLDLTLNFFITLFLMLCDCTVIFILYVLFLSYLSTQMQYI